MALFLGLPMIFDGKGNCDRRSTSFAVGMAGLSLAADAIGDLERFLLSRFDDLSLDAFGDNLLLSYDDLRGDFELSLGDVLNDLLLPLALPAKPNTKTIFNKLI